MKKLLNKIIVIIVILVLVVLAYIFIKKRDITFALNGNESIVLKYASDYNELGFIAHDGLGKDIKDNVKVTANINNVIPGIYEVLYELNYNGISKVLKRKVTVLEPNTDDYELILNGEEEISIPRGNNYNEKGAYVLIRASGEKINEIDINSNVDTSLVGEYQVIYSYQSNNILLSKTRKVNVFDIIYKVTRNGSKANIEFDFNTIKDYMKITLPSGEEITDKNISYQVEKNDNYKFIITISNVNYEKVVNVTNAGVYKCSGVINRNGTTLSITEGEVSNIKEYEWNTSNSKITKENRYNEYRIINNASVNITFNDNSKYLVACDIKNNLYYLFKYDEFNNKPYMACNTYTENDRIVLEEKLKKSIEEAGYGTRAGVVEAARFLVGGLDYKIRYLGPKAANSALGRYEKVGLNIGKKDGWGCRVSGYIQGMDCTNFVSWAFYQNGITNFPYSTTHSKVVDVVDKLQVGDLLFTPDTSATCRNKYCLDHVGIIIGIDDNYLYVAESTEETTYAIVVSKWEKNNMPKKGKFSLAHFFTKYNGNGNITNMWLQ